MNKLLIPAIAAFAFTASQALAWDGYDWEQNTDITIESGNLVRPGQEIEYYDWGKGEYKYGDVEGINSIGNTVEVEIYDYDEGEYRTFEMHD